MKIMMPAAAFALMIGASALSAQTTPQATPDQTMPDQTMPAQPPEGQTPDAMGTEANPPMQTPDAGATMSDTDKRKMASCMKKSQEAMMKDKKCAALMEAHPEMMPNSG